MHRTLRRATSLFLAGIGLLGATAATAATGAATDPWQTVSPGGATVCATGEPYRFHVRRADPARLLIFFNGGGACWNARICDPAGEPTSRLTAGPGSGNDPRAYDGAFDLTNAENPFLDYSQVFVSYCTGDVHLGAAEVEYVRDDGTAFTIHHAGLANAQTALEYVYAQFPEPQRVVVAGGSAGALASPVYAAVVAGHYPTAAVTHLAGGGAGYRMPAPAALWRTWGTIPALPPVIETAGVTPDTLRITDLYRLAAAAAPRLRFHTYDHAFDAVQESFHALLGHPTTLLDGLDANLRELHQDLPYLRSYVAAGEFHTLLRYRELYTRSTDGIRAVTWVRDAITPDASVVDVHCRADGNCR